MVMPSKEQDRVRVIMERTRDNLDFVQKNKGASGPWEVTQLINSFLGAFAHPKETWLERIPQGPPPSDWPSVPTDHGYPDPTGCADLVRLIRNSLAHGNLDLLPDTKVPPDIRAIRLWNTNRQCAKTWGTELSIEEMEKLLRAFVKMMLDLDDKAQAKKNSKGAKAPP